MKNLFSNRLHLLDFRQNKLKVSGFTIVELITTIAVAGVLTASIAVVLTSQSHLSQIGRDLALTNAYAEHKIESLRSAGFLNLSDGATNITDELPSELKGNRSGTLTISTYSDAIKLVELSVTYNDQGATKTYSYSTYIGELGVGQY